MKSSSGVRTALTDVVFHDFMNDVYKVLSGKLNIRSEEFVFHIEPTQSGFNLVLITSYKLPNEIVSGILSSGIFNRYLDYFKYMSYKLNIESQNARRVIIRFFFKFTGVSMKYGSYVKSYCLEKQKLCDCLQGFTKVGTFILEDSGRYYNITGTDGTIYFLFNPSTDEVVSRVYNLNTSQKRFISSRVISFLRVLNSQCRVIDCVSIDRAMYDELYLYIVNDGGCTKRLFWSDVNTV